MARGPGWFDMGRAAHLVHFISSGLADSGRAPRATFNAKTFYRFPESVRTYTIGNYPSKKGFKVHSGSCKASRIIQV